MNELVFVAIASIVIFIVVYRKNNGTDVYKYILVQTSNAYNKFAPYSFKEVRDKVRGLGRDYTVREYSTQVAIFAVSAFFISFMYFYSIIVSLIYALLSILVVPYLAYLRHKRVYSEFVFEQIQVYTTNVIMDFATTQSFVKSLEGVYESGVLEDPIKSDVRTMIDMAYENGTIVQSINYFNNKYPFYIVKNMHQIFLQITNEGSRDSSNSLENMSLDIDMLVESVYRDRLDRASFHKKFVQFGIILYFMVMMIQFLLGYDTYIKILSELWVQAILHGVVIVNTYFLLSGEKYYNENVGAE
jgi:hypothetical protein